MKRYALISNISLPLKEFSSISEILLESSLISTPELGISENWSIKTDEKLLKDSSISNKDGNPLKVSEILEQHELKE